MTHHRGRKLPRVLAAATPDQAGHHVERSYAMSTERIREAIERASAIFTERPEAARRQGLAVTARLTGGLKCEVRCPGDRVVHTDMSVPLGGEGTAPSPGTLLRASLASCTATVIAMRAARLGISLRTLEVTVESDSDLRGLLGTDDSVSAGFSALRTRVRIGADGVSRDQVKTLIDWSDAHSPVCCTVRHPPVNAIEVDAA
jgi:uncharacterized OsmC-like protein